MAYFNHCLSVLYVVICQNIGILSVITTSQYSYSAAPVLHCPSVLVLVWAHLHTANAGLDCAELVTQLPHQYNLLHLLTSHITIYIMFLHYIHYQARSIEAFCNFQYRSNQTRHLRISKILVLETLYNH